MCRCHSASCASGNCATVISNVCANSRPITAPICATCFAAGSRSSRAVSEACSVIGTSRVAALPIRMLGILHHNLGQLLDEQRDAIGLRDNPLEQRAGQHRLDGNPFDQFRCLFLRQPPQGDQAGGGKANPGRLESVRNETINRMGRSVSRPIALSSNSSVLASAQWASSNSMRTGRRRLRVASARRSASKIFSFLRCGLRSNVG